MNWKVLGAIFKRNFLSYLSNPTGYVFICVFVALNSVAAFWPVEFFNSNLANLEQLNVYLPLIMLAFIPAITMSIWAEERRQGTDELLLTIPATDMEVVLGKFLAALAIFTVSLGMSLVANLAVLVQLGRPDLGLYLSSYLGYWFMGMAMLGVGMVASFLTGNLTVGFVLGALFNVPLAFSGWAEAIIPGERLAQWFRQWSVAEQVADFNRGVISLSSIAYFVLVTAVALYLSMVLIGRRHWLGGKDGSALIGHYAVRTCALAALALGLSYFFTNHDWLRVDVTTEKLTSLSPDARRLMRDLGTERPVVVEAYVSPSVPREYVQAKLNMLSMLRELESTSGGNVHVQMHVVEPFSDEAARASQKYGIEPRTVTSKVRGARKEEEIFLAAAFRCGLDKHVIPFMDKGLPTEYELVRSICTVAQPSKKRVGVVQTDVPLFSRFSMQGMTQEQQFIVELRKQYEVDEVDASQPIPEGRYDVLLAVQPSMLSEDKMAHFVAAVKRGQPTAIFEDPFPIPGVWQGVAGSGQPRMPQQAMSPFQRPQPPTPKGNIEPLWEALGVKYSPQKLVWQDYSPYPQNQSFIEPDWVFIAPGSYAGETFSPDSKITADMEQVLLLYPGSFEDGRPPDPKEETKENVVKRFTPLLTVGGATGTVLFNSPMDTQEILRGDDRRRSKTGFNYVLAAQIREQLESAELQQPLQETGADDQPDAGEQSAVELEDDFGLVRNCQPEEEGATTEGEAAVASAEGSEPADGAEAGEPEATAESPAETFLNVIVVADIDCLLSDFFQIRAMGEEEDIDFNWKMQNVAFLLNVVDSLADDQRFLQTRKRRRRHRTLETFENSLARSRIVASEKVDQFNAVMNEELDKAQTAVNERLEKLRGRDDLDPRQKAFLVQTMETEENRKLAVKREQLRQDALKDIRAIERDLALQISRAQNWYKLQAVLVPPIFPLLIGLAVFFHRRNQEREGVAQSRLR